MARGGKKGRKNISPLPKARGHAPSTTLCNIGKGNSLRHAMPVCLGFVVHVMAQEWRADRDTLVFLLPGIRMDIVRRHSRPGTRVNQAHKLTRVSMLVAQ